MYITPGPRRNDRKKGVMSGLWGFSGGQQQQLVTSVLDAASSAVIGSGLNLRNNILS